MKGAIMKTLNKEKSEEIFNKFQRISDAASILSGVVSNPDAINKDNAKENYELFLDDYIATINDLMQLKLEVEELYYEVIK
jgi:uncharacterized protein (DUF2235 family)